MSKKTKQQDEQREAEGWEVRLESELKLIFGEMIAKFSSTGDPDIGYTYLGIVTDNLKEFIRREIEAARREVLDTIFLRSCFVTEYTHLGRQTDYQRGMREGESREKQTLVKLLKQKYLTNDDNEQRNKT